MSAVEEEYEVFVASNQDDDDTAVGWTPPPEMINMAKPPQGVPTYMEAPVTREIAVGPRTGVPVALDAPTTGEIDIAISEERPQRLPMGRLPLPPITPRPEARLPPPMPFPAAARTKTPRAPDTRFAEMNLMIQQLRIVLAERAQPIDEVEIDGIEFKLRERIAKL